jgi:predicted transglutaminase-like cysteine proteinase
LLNDNWHNIPGAGDCDCFTISTIALLISQGWKNIKIILVGRSEGAPVHIYTVIYWKGKRKVLDLTNKKYNQERKYPLIQELPVNWQNW